MTKESGGFLKSVYRIGGSKDARALYRDWAESYESEIRANGYATPRRCAEALASLTADKTAPLLDLGCGTGLSGEAFRAAGFTVIDGTDFTEEMLAVARRKPDLYRRLLLGDLSNPLPAAPGDYAQIAAVGVLSPSHAPPVLIGQVLSLLPPGGLFVFSLNDHTLAHPAFEQAIQDLTAAGDAELAFRAYGDHLPGQNLKADVVVLRRPS